MRNFQWYMISTVSGKEDKVVESLKNRIVSEQVDDCFNENACEEGAFKIFKKPVLTAKEAEKKALGEPYKIKMNNIYNGYIFINMDMTDQAWFVVRNTQYVTGLIGSAGKGTKPTPVSKREIEASFHKEKQLISDFKEGKIEGKFLVGEIVEIIDGPFKGTIGKVLETFDNIKKVTVEVEHFGKKVPTDFDYSVVESQEA
ncbi:transcription termination/antitermination protein NusG [Mycoplasma tauri]|uniref:Transcription termination/antitermination protein NusG n=1 Tax=Mycoplasma tauri TaxID=547987 RepID=A0A953NGW3_9MOLU|nr:transcription termination/antitermination protein NusG [Mycoplasma tauri]MBZ4195461.1 transcription termination/antitermination protein NusG [Mycoplasma tauri]MBZ4203859.1 transcription termination/antitermination protein NusG [Mycoplasma tauri]MBZ4203985.1 transcription termination/antitermination protein NusG [Mycoplasma tauri]MBZ4218478.1 transcription termination/antitermination protein NusG [Mycoplasma tauri]MBZ4227076.1 transcription termination/antitermination protein NusG [Mycoplasm